MSANLSCTDLDRKRNMKIFIGAQLSFLTPGKQSLFEMAFDQPTPIVSVLEDLNIPKEMVHLLIINGKLANIENATVSDQDDVIVYPYISGG